MAVERAEHEIQHGKFLSEGDTELIWGWGTPAGRLRAQRRAKLIEVGARLGPDSHILEIGCGTGMFTEMFAQTGCSIIAVDISAALLEKAKARNITQGNVQFMQKRFEDCTVEGPFDAIIGSSVLHHLELKESFSSIHKLLKPNGIMSFAEPNMLNPQVFMERRFRKLFPYVSPDETAFVRWPLKLMLEESGFTGIEITPFDWLHPSVPSSLINSVSVIGHTLEKIPFIREFSGSLYIKGVKNS
ncbi:MAG: class I SAM-dependent methyltransferase [Candidatus Electrothrix sp. AW2]|nr:class I SAM-dependent methyltransferase [Candidatus Electrothrix gigas]